MHGIIRFLGVVGILLVAAVPAAGQFAPAVLVTSDSSGFENADMTGDIANNIFFAFQKGGDIYFASTVSGSLVTAEGVLRRDLDHPVHVPERLRTSGAVHELWLRSDGGRPRLLPDSRLPVRPPVADGGVRSCPRGTGTARFS